MTKILLAAAAVLSLSTGSALALRSELPISRDSGQTVYTPHGAVVTTGHVGQMQTTTMPGLAGPGLLTDEGNGVGTMMGPTGALTSVQMPR